MANTATALHELVDRWLAPGPAAPLRVVEFRKGCARQESDVKVESHSSTRTVAMFFFVMGMERGESIRNARKGRPCVSQA